MLNNKISLPFIIDYINQSKIIIHKLNCKSEVRLVIIYLKLFAYQFQIDHQFFSF